MGKQNNIEGIHMKKSNLAGNESQGAKPTQAAGAQGPKTLSESHLAQSKFEKIGEILSGNHSGSKVSIRGWVHRSRTSGGLAFIVVRDSTGVIQCAVKKDAVGDDSFQQASTAYLESTIVIEGTAKEDKRAPGGYELAATGVQLISKGEPFPIAKDQSVEFLLDTRHLWLRSQKLTNIMKARHLMIKYLREFFESEGFWELAPPMITGAACEGGSTLFEMDYFGQKAYLTQSSQLYAEVFTTALEKVFVLAPSFRAEPSRTVRHLCEYWHLEPEMAFYNQKMNMELQEKMLETVCQKMAANHADILQALGRDPDKLKAVKAPFMRMTYEDAVELAIKKGANIKMGQDIGADEEALLTCEEEKPIFVTNFPKDIKAFYMREDPENPGTVLNADCLAPEGHGEIIGGSERIWNYDELMARIKENNLNPKDYGWYIDLRRYGSYPHSGFGLGI
ncbi:asparagine--tRNA ligase, partial [Candidatus Parvarchaeota archaeon]|nr:asparagine--tRNA ligase [Candidatus Parvarchaeota archaeon]